MKSDNYLWKNNRIQLNVYLWLKSLWNEEKPETSEISKYDWSYIRSCWFQQSEARYGGLGKVKLSNHQIKICKKIYNRYQNADVRNRF